jgi:2-C-methyl-D-erythritol 4-phosphate cytidylyltransferase
MTSKKKLSIILLAGGQGTRMQTSIPKQFLPLQGKPLALHSFDFFTRTSLPIEEIVIVCESHYQTLFAHPTHKILFAKPGTSRQFSVMHGFQALSQDVDFIMIHDSARPFLQEDDLRNLFEEAVKTGAATLAHRVSTTIKQTNGDNLVTCTLNRANLWDVQTPQCLHRSLLEEGFKKVIEESLIVTDDVSLAELQNHPVKIVKGSSKNFKITTLIDFQLAEVIANG